MQMREEEAFDVGHADAGVGEAAMEFLLGVLGVQARVDQAPATIALDEIRVDVLERGDGERDLDAADAGRDEIAQRT